MGDLSNDATAIRAAVDLFSTIMRSSADRLLHQGGAESFGAALTDSLAAIRAVLDTPRKAQQ